METVVLKCGTDTVLHTCDTNWTASAATPWVDTSDKMEGSGCVYFTTAGTGLQVYKALVSPKNLSGLLAVQLWVKAPSNISAGKLAVRLSDAADASTSIEDIALPYLCAGWNLVVVPIAAPEDCTAIASIGIVQVVAGTLALKIDNVLAVNARSYETYGVKGLDDVDGLRLWPQTQNTCSNGEIRNVYSAYARMPSFRIRPSATKVDRVWLVTNFALSSTRTMIYANEELLVAFKDGSVPFSSIWLNNSPIARAYQMDLMEQSVRSTNPTLWN